MARTKDPKLEEDRLRRITEATVELLCEASWQSVTLSKVAERTGVSKGVVTYWFLDKDALLIESMRRFYQRKGESLVEVLSVDEPPEVRLRRLVESAFPDAETIRRESAFQDEVRSYAKHNHEARAHLTSVLDEYRGLVRGLLTVAASSGHVKRKDAPELDRFVLALADGLMHQVSLEPEPNVPQIRERALGLIRCWLNAE